MRNDCEPHMDVRSAIDRKQCIGGAGRNTRKVLAEIAGNQIGENDGRTVLLVKQDRSVRTGLRTIAASRASIEKQRFLDGARRTQPILPHCGRGLFRNRLGMFGKLLRCLGHGQDRILQEIAPAVFGVGGHWSIGTGPKPGLG